MSLELLARFGAICGVILGLSLGVPGAIEAFTGETTATSLVVGLGAGFGAPALVALYLRQFNVAGRFGAVAFAVNLLGLGLFAGVAFSLNLVLFFVDQATVEAVMSGPTRFAVLGSAVVFVIGTILFGLSMIISRVLPRAAAWGYMVFLTVLALLAPLPDTVFTSIVHILACISLVWLSVAAWRVPSTP